MILILVYTANMPVYHHIKNNKNLGFLIIFIIIGQQNYLDINYKCECTKCAN